MWSAWGILIRVSRNTTINTTAIIILFLLPPSLLHQPIRLENIRGQGEWGRRKEAQCREKDGNEAKKKITRREGRRKTKYWIGFFQRKVLSGWDDFSRQPRQKAWKIVAFWRSYSKTIIFFLSKCFWNIEWCKTAMLQTILLSSFPALLKHTIQINCVKSAAV